MSKSLGNFFTVRDVAEQYDYSVIRLFLISAHYRSPMNFSKEALEAAESSLKRIVTCVENLKFKSKAKVPSQLDPAFAKRMDGYREAFCRGMDDDLNTADALASVFDAVKAANAASDTLSKEDLDYAASVIVELCAVLGLTVSKEKETLSDKVEALIAQRTEARKNKNYARADEIRDELKAMGIVLEDTAQGVKWRKA